MPDRQAPRDVVAADRDRRRSQSEPKAAREKAGCEQVLMTRWQGRLADGDQKVASQGLGRASEDWSQERERHLSREGSKVRRQPDGEGGLSPGCAVQPQAGSLGAREESVFT